MLLHYIYHFGGGTQQVNHLTHYWQLKTVFV